MTILVIIRKRCRKTYLITIYDLIRDLGTYFRMNMGNFASHPGFGGCVPDENVMLWRASARCGVEMHSGCLHLTLFRYDGSA